MKNKRPLYHGYRFPQEIISHTVWLYHRVPQRRTRDGSRMRSSVLCQSCREDDGRPVDVGCQEQASNHPKRLSLRVVVVSVGGNVEHDSAGVDQKDERK
jgi:hypothetical protein